jgi:hypothetical protein
MQINWRLKSFIFSIISFFSLQFFLLFLQKHVTKRSKVDFLNLDPDWLFHQKNLSSLTSTNVFEFGAGQSLSQNIYLSQFFNNQTVVDIFPMLSLTHFNSASLLLSKITKNNNLFKPVANVNDISIFFNIQYLAPLDISFFKFPPDSFDACISTNTLEHIPKHQLVQIFNNLKNIICNDGLISIVIDYSDHYAYTDSTISRLNFLSFSTIEFNTFNHKVHFQNRLRHTDYLELFKSLGFEVIYDNASDFTTPPNFVSPEFDLGDPLLFSTKGNFLLRINK